MNSLISLTLMNLFQIPFDRSRNLDVVLSFHITFKNFPGDWTTSY